MIRCRRYRWLPLLRVLVLGLFALGLVLQPVLAAAGEMHEFAHDPSGQHAHVPHADDLVTDSGTTDEQDNGPSKTLHVLLHFAHCCGAAAALLPMPKPITLAPMHSQLAIVKAAIRPPANLPSPFKPPILA